MRRRVSARPSRSRRRVTISSSNDQRMEMLEFAAALIAVDRIGYERLRVSPEPLAAWLISGFTKDEWEFMQEQAIGNSTSVVEAIRR
jgi:hypothetical protein